MAYHWKSRKNLTAHVQNSALPAVKSSPLNSAMEKSACTMSGKVTRCTQRILLTETKSPESNLKSQDKLYKSYIFTI